MPEYGQILEDDNFSSICFQIIVKKDQNWNLSFKIDQSWMS